MNETIDLLTNGDILSIVSFKPTKFDELCAEWRDAGIVQPVSGGFGTRKHRQWTLMQAIGFAVAEAVRQTEQGCVDSYVGKTVAAFGAVDDEWLKKQLDKGAIYYVGPHQGRPLLQGGAPGLNGCGNSFPDVRKAIQPLVKLVVDRVVEGTKERIKELAAKPKLASPPTKRK